MKIYNYSDSGEFIGESIAGVSPLDGLPLIPRNSTTIATPKIPSGSIAIFDGTGWLLNEDHRGEVWYKKGTIEKIEIDFLGKIDEKLFQKYPEPISVNEKWNNVRSKRNILLSGSDWTQLDDSKENKESWASYRQELRDIPQTFSTPESVIWPSKP